MGKRTVLIPLPIIPLTFPGLYEMNSQLSTVQAPGRPVTPAITDAEKRLFAPHPLLPLPPLETIAADIVNPATRAETLAALSQRAKRLEWAAEDPLHGRLRLPQSYVVDELLRKYQLVYESGGKRAGKTEDGVPRFLACCLKYGKAKRWAMQDNPISSIANLQERFWHYLPTYIKRLAGKRNAVFRVHWNTHNGFDGLLVLPNGCEIYFLNYTQDPQDFLGWELGKDINLDEDPKIPDIGALLDENCPLTWLENIKLRCSTRGARIHWMYSPQEGITPAIKDVTANCKTIETKPSELLPDRVNVPGCPAGHMPYIRTDEKTRTAVFHRFTQWNPFSGYDRPGGVRELCAARPPDYVMRHAYGYCEDVKGRVFPLFGEWNVVRHEDIPAEGTNTLVTDPAGARNWASGWFRACPGGDFYLYREWPDQRTYGDWATISQNPKKLNGDRGSAAATIGYGPTEYKSKVFLANERVPVPSALLNSEIQGSTFDGSTVQSFLEDILATIPDQLHRALIRQALESGDDLDHLYEPIFERLIDPRAAGTKSATERGHVDLIHKLAQEDRNPKTGELLAAPMYFIPAAGFDIQHGLSKAADLLFFNMHQERVPLINAPHFFVSERCRNFIWAMNHYSLPTDSETTDDACEDWVDILRYYVTRGPRYILPGGKVQTTGGGSY